MELISDEQNVNEFCIFYIDSTSLFNKLLSGLYKQMDLLPNLKNWQRITHRKIKLRFKKTKLWLIFPSLLNSNKFKFVIVNLVAQKLGEHIFNSN